MRAAIYARVSTTDQHNEIQVRELTEYVARRGWELTKVYEDHMSGAKARRPGLDALTADAQARRFDAVIVWKLDRFGRSLVNCVAGIQELTALGVRFIAVSQGWTPMNRIRPRGCYSTFSPPWRSSRGNSSESEYRRA